MPTRTLPSLPDQAETLIHLGVADLAGLSPDTLRDAARTDPGGDDELLVVHPRRAPASALAPLVHHREQAGFVVVDMTDVDDFAAVPEAAPPDADVYRLGGLDRGDHLASWSPDEALPELLATGRTPLTLAEGLQWLLQQPEVLDRNHCFMTIGSRLRRTDGRLDARTPAIWISNGTGRDGRERRHAPKVGWCWAGNRHTWLGFASATSRRRA